MARFRDIGYRRRKYFRTPIAAFCDILAPDLGRTLGRGCVKNFSRGGLAVVTPTHVFQGRTVGILIDGLLQKKWIVTRVMNVRNSTERIYSCGLQFEGLGLLARNRIESRLKKMAQAKFA